MLSKYIYLFSVFCLLILVMLGDLFEDLMDLVDKVMRKW